MTVPHVVCLGDLMVDVLARLPGPLAPGSDTPAPVRLTGGGAAANVACWLVAAGAQATFVGRAGDDALGRQAVADLIDAGVEARVSVDPQRPTGTCIVLVAPDGERTMVPDNGANAGLGEIAPDLPEHADALYVSGYALLGAGSRPFALEAMRIARERGWPIVVDAASAAPLQTDPDFLARLGRDVLVLANSDEALVLTELDDAAAAAQSLALRTGTAVVKRGAAGAVWSDGSGVRSVPAVPADVVDTTGAGDAFAAGFLAAWLAGVQVGEALVAGTQLGAHAVGTVGARPEHSPRKPRGTECSNSIRSSCARPGVT
ncbi:carbohydrate kinase family protein [uncultured Jatrophihabitans sp.]|uniref:carbohydrate kinase family protein n=1 Tax=uncultured Jatrophihabitans sp. TaxID=1610747 RepID=UPI0035CC7CFB